MRADAGQKGSSADRRVPGCSSSLRSLMLLLSLDPKVNGVSRRGREGCTVAVVV